MQHLSTIDFAYIAGIVDGEGTITIGRGRKNYHYNWTYNAVVGVTNTNLELLNWLRDSTRIGNICQNTKILGSKQGYQWNLRSYEILNFLEYISLFLKIKKEQAKIVTEFLIKNRPSNKHQPATELEIEFRCSMYYRIHALNEKGDDNV